MLALPHGRRLILSSLETLFDNPCREPFAALVPAFDAVDRERVAAITSTLIVLGCVEFCCVGPQAEELHDSIDGIVEERGAVDVVTTWHTVDYDACEYFLFAAGGGISTLLALVSPHAELVALLEEEARSM